MVQSPPTRQTPQSPSMQHLMRYGAALGTYMSLCVLSLLLYRFEFLGTLVSIGLFVGTPLVMVLLARTYRERELGGYVRYREAMLFMVGSFLFALLIVIPVSYVTFSLLLADEQFVGMLQESTAQVKALFPDDPEMQEALEASLETTPRDLTIQTTFTTLFLGLLFNYIAALFVVRKKQP